MVHYRELPEDQGGITCMSADPDQLLKEQSNQGLLCLPFLQQFSDPILYDKTRLFKF